MDVNMHEEVPDPWKTPQEDTIEEKDEMEAPWIVLKAHTRYHKTQAPLDEKDGMEAPWITLKRVHKPPKT